MSAFLDALRQRVLLCDGAMGSRVQALSLDVERDFLGQENCTEILTRARPDLIRDIHRSYLAAGSDLLQTNSFGGSPITPREFGLAAEAACLKRPSGGLPRPAGGEFAGDGRRR